MEFWIFEIEKFQKFDDFRNEKIWNFWIYQIESFLEL